MRYGASHVDVCASDGVISIDDGFTQAETLRVRQLSLGGERPSVYWRPVRCSRPAISTSVASAFSTSIASAYSAFAFASSIFAAAFASAVSPVTLASALVAALVASSFWDRVVASGRRDGIRLVVGWRELARRRGAVRRVAR